MKFAMEKEKASYFIKMLQDITGATSFDEAKLEPFVEQMVLMSSLLEDFAVAQSPEEIRTLGSRIRACQKEGEGIANDFLSSFGTTKEELQEYFNSSANLSKTEWEMVQGMQKKLLMAAGEKPPMTLNKKRMKKRETI